MWVLKIHHNYIYLLKILFHIQTLERRHQKYGSFCTYLQEIRKKCSLKKYLEKASFVIYKIVTKLDRFRDSPQLKIVRVWGNIWWKHQKHVPFIFFSCSLLAATAGEGALLDRPRLSKVVLDKNRKVQFVLCETVMKQYKTLLSVLIQLTSITAKL